MGTVVTFFVALLNDKLWFFVTYEIQIAEQNVKGIVNIFQIKHGVEIKLESSYKFFLSRGFNLN